MRGTLVHDLRHRFSYELRPAAVLDRRVRELAQELEDQGLLLAGAATAPRFHPHLTLLRADTPQVDAARRAADVFLAAGAADAAVRFATADAFGVGRIPFLEPDDRAAFEACRAELVGSLGADHVDPLVHERAWTPHLSVAYAVPEAHRETVLARVRETLPLVGAWSTLEIWDLDVRPTVLVERILLT